MIRFEIDFDQFSNHFRSMMETSSNVECLIIDTFDRYLRFDLKIRHKRVWLFVVGWTDV